MYHQNRLSVNLFILFLLFIFSINNEPLSIKIVKSWNISELIMMSMSILIILNNKVQINKLHKISFLLVLWMLVCVLYNINNFPAEHYVTEESSIFTRYGTRSLATTAQIAFNILMSMILASYLISLPISGFTILKSYVRSITLFSLFGIIIYILQVIGFKFGFIQSNELSYSSYRLYSLAREPQYTALWIVPAIFISLKYKFKLDLIICFIALFLTRSTSVIFGFGVASLFYSIKRYGIKNVIKLFPLLLLIIIMVLSLTYQKGFAFVNSLMNVGDDTNDFARGYSMYLASKLAADNLSFGIGWGNFSYYFIWRGEEKIFNIGNIFLRSLSEIGVIGFLIISILFKRIYDYSRICGLEYVCILITFLVYFMANSTYFTFISFWIYLSLLYCFYRKCYDFKKG